MDGGPTTPTLLKHFGSLKAANEAMPGLGTISAQRVWTAYHDDLEELALLGSPTRATRAIEMPSSSV